MAEDRWTFLKRAVKKINFLLNFNHIINKLKLASIVGASSSTRRRLSFNDRPGLRACVEESASGSSRRLRRATSCDSATSEDDQNNIDKRADAFIANFYKQLQYERQISLQLRYYRGNSFDSSTSP